jgi:hypothetical protein
MGSGKSEVAKYLMWRHSFVGHSFSNGVYHIANDLFGMEGKDRHLLQSIGSSMRAINPDVFVNYSLGRMNFEENIVIDDLRFDNEYERLKDLGFTVIRVVCDESDRVERMKRIYPNWKEHLLLGSHESETQDIQCDGMIYNNSSVEDFHDSIEGMLTSTLKDLQFNLGK